MNASSIETNQQREVGKPHAATSLPCPSWCILPSGHDVERDPRDYSSGDERWHIGPRFGELRIEGGDHTGFYVYMPEVEFGREHGHDTTSAMAAALRGLSGDLVALSTWLERHP